MKKIVMLFIVIPIAVLAQFEKATITFADGSTKKGYVNVPDQPNNTNLRFKFEENSEIEKLNIDTIRSFEVVIEEGKTIQYATIYVAYTNPFHPQKISVNKRKSWVRVVKEGRITMYALDKLNYNIMLNSTSFYCLKKENQDYAIYLGDYMYGTEGNWRFNLSNFNTFKDAIRQHFKDECPQLSDLIDKEDFKKKWYGQISRTL